MSQCYNERGDMSNEPKINDEELTQELASAQIVGHAEASSKQIEQAIFLWFHKDSRQISSEAIAIHTLAVAALGVLWAYAHDSRQRPSELAQKIHKDPRYSRLKDAHNFFKHGSTGRKEKGKRTAVIHSPGLTEIFLADDICTFNRLFRTTSALFETFLLRYSLSFPKCGVSLKTLEMKLIDAGYTLDSIGKLDRIGFYDIVATYALENLRDSTRHDEAS